MDRAEVIRLLTELREAGEMGSPRWSRLMEAIREQGYSLHEPSFVTCKDCGAEFEPPVSAELNSRHKVLRCAACRTATTRIRPDQRNTA